MTSNYDLEQFEAFWTFGIDDARFRYHRCCFTEAGKGRILKEFLERVCRDETRHLGKPDTQGFDSHHELARALRWLEEEIKRPYPQDLSKKLNP